MSVTLRRSSIALLLLGIAACTKDVADKPSPTALVAVSGNLQRALIGAPLPQPLVVKVVDQYGAVVVGTSVAFSVVGGGGTIAPATVTTDAQGVASAVWTLGTTTGVQEAQVISSGVKIASPISFSATAIDVTIAGTISLSPNSEMAELGFGPGRAPDALVASARARIAESSQHPDHVAGELLVTYYGDAMERGWTAQSVATRAGAEQMSQQMMQLARSMIPATEGTVLRASAPLRYVVVKAVSDSAGQALMARLRADRRVEAVEWNGYMHQPVMSRTPLEQSEGEKGSWQARVNMAAADEVVPNDPLWLNQAWHYRFIDLPRAWARQQGSAAVNVTVIDDGSRPDHPDMGGVFSTDGYDFVQAEPTDAIRECTTNVVVRNSNVGGRSADPTRLTSFALATVSGVTCWARETAGGHGLHVAGTIAARANNGTGGAGVAAGVRVRALKVFGAKSNLGGTFDDIAQAVLYSAGLPAVGAAGATVQSPRATIVNMSLGGGDVTVMRNAISAAVNAGVLIIASAGNDNTTFGFFPASYPGVLSVAATGPDGNAARYSNGGAAVAIAAPGGDPSFWNIGSAGVLSTVWNFVNNTGSYAYYAGTSMAAPHVTGVAALLLSAEPTLTAADMRARLTQFASPVLGPQRSDLYGAGYLNAFSALARTRARGERTQLRLVSATSGDTVRTAIVTPGQPFSMSRVSDGRYFVVAAQDQDADGLFGGAGKRFGAVGRASAPTEIVVANQVGGVANILLSFNVENEPNDSIATANRLFVNSTISARFDQPDPRDMYVVQIPRAGGYVFETSPVNGACGFGIELDSNLSLLDAAGAVLATNDDIAAATGNFCSRVTQTLQPGTYHVQVTNSTGQVRRWRYRLSVRAL